MPSPAYSDALRRRLEIIDQRGQEQTTWEKARQALKREEELRNQALAQQEAQYNSSMMAGQNQQAMSGNFSNNAFESFVNSIAGKESGGNYSAVNKHSGALGKYQIMPSNLKGKKRGWDYDALGYDVSASQFLQSPEIQEKVARYQLQNYYNKYGPAGASIAWYAGPSAAQKYANSGYVSNNGQANGYPSIKSYMDAILNGIKWG